jgi:hypothetical protein
MSSLPTFTELEVAWGEKQEIKDNPIAKECVSLSSFSGPQEKEQNAGYAGRVVMEKYQGSGTNDPSYVAIENEAKVVCSDTGICVDKPQKKGPAYPYISRNSRDTSVVEKYTEAREEDSRAVSFHDTADRIPVMGILSDVYGSFNTGSILPSKEKGSFLDVSRPIAEEDPKKLEKEVKSISRSGSIDSSDPGWRETLLLVFVSSVVILFSGTIVGFGQSIAASK